jgi:hypothetical protein
MVEFFHAQRSRDGHLHIEIPLEQLVLALRRVELEVGVVLKEEAARALDEIAQGEAPRLERLLAEVFELQARGRVRSGVRQRVGSRAGESAVGQARPKLATFATSRYL